MRPVSVYSEGWLTGTGGQPKAVYSDGWLGNIQIPVNPPSDGRGGASSRIARARYEEDMLRLLMREDDEILSILWGFVHVQ
jgi:hypothetical protein